MYVTYRIITTRRRAIRQRLPDELVEPFFLLAVITAIIIGVGGAHEAGYDEGHDDACVRAWLGRVYVYTWEERGSFFKFLLLLVEIINGWRGRRLGVSYIV